MTISLYCLLVAWENIINNLTHSAKTICQVRLLLTMENIDETKKHPHLSSLDQEK